MRPALLAILLCVLSACRGSVEGSKEICDLIYETMTEQQRECARRNGNILAGEMAIAFADPSALSQLCAWNRTAEFDGVRCQRHGLQDCFRAAFTSKFCKNAGPILAEDDCYAKWCVLR